MNDSDLQTGGIGFDTLVEQIRQIDEQARRDTARAVNIGLTLRNWSIGFYIDHYELKGADRSKYGDELYHRLAEGLRAWGVKSCDRRQLYRYRDFFQTYPQIVGALSPQFAALMPPAPESAAETAPSQKVGAVTSRLSIPPDRLLNSLSYTHLE
ncbi:MAG: DUF1016 N-terminal domain-containing protein, partial [Pirellulales bacterium]|nr:DUF1016 N-terminal domain-containing protein [Pirellulales bacterium]